MKRINFSKSAPLPKSGWAPPKKGAPKVVSTGKPGANPPSRKDALWLDGDIDLGVDFGSKWLEEMKSYRQAPPDDVFSSKYSEQLIKKYAAKYARLEPPEMKWYKPAPKPEPQMKFYNMWMRDDVLPNPPRSRRAEAVLRLWKEAARGVVLRHPNPAVDVELWVGRSEDDPFGNKYSFSWQAERTLIRVTLRNLPNTQDMDKRMAVFPAVAQSFDHWPGERVAQAFFVAMMCVYMQHETMELATKRYDSRYSRHGAGCQCRYNCCGPIIDAHNSYEWHQNYAVRTPLDICDLIKGPGWTAKELAANRTVADKELRNEVDFLTNGGY